MTDPPRYPVAWTVDARVPDEVRALIASIGALPERMGKDEVFAWTLEIRATASRIKDMIDHIPAGKAIPTD